MSIDDWLTSIGLDRYLELFRENDIDTDILAELDEEDLEKIGVTSLGHRKKMLRAIRDLLREGTALAAPNDAEPLIALLNDADVSEEAFATDLASTLRAGQAKRKTHDARRSGPDLMEVWEKMDRGEISSASFISPSSR